MAFKTKKSRMLENREFCCGCVHHERGCCNNYCNIVHESYVDFVTGEIKVRNEFCSNVYATRRCSYEHKVVLP